MYCLPKRNEFFYWSETLGTIYEGRNSPNGSGLSAEEAGVSAEYDFAPICDSTAATLHKYLLGKPAESLAPPERWLPG
jgi:hypothetical protein